MVKKRIIKYKMYKSVLLKDQRLTYCAYRYFRQDVQQKRQEKPKADFHIYSEPPKNCTRDMIGPVHPESNIRSIKLFRPENESYHHKHFRELRQEAHQWNHLFWAKHNSNFFQQKEKYVKKKLKEKKLLYGPDADQTLSPEELSEFYKKFLDENYAAHAEYNKEWYKRNIRLLGPAIRVFIENMQKKLHQKMFGK